jgi:hypothetical protein
MVGRTETQLLQSKQNLKLVGMCVVQQKIYIKLEKRQRVFSICLLT